MPYPITHLLSIERCPVMGNITSKKSAIEMLSRLIAGDLVNVNHQDLFFELIEREKLGSTYIGDGVAIPHARSNKVTAPIGALMHLSQPILYAKEEKIEVDLLFGLIVPYESTQSHLEILSTLASIFHEEKWREQLRSSTNNENLYHAMIQISGVVT